MTPDDRSDTHLPEEEQGIRERDFSRRELLRAGWGIPAVLVSGGVLAACGDDHGDAHGDHTDAPHDDAVHTDTHTDGGQRNPGGHSDTGGGGHSDRGGHGDTPHVDTPHGDAAHGDDAHADRTTTIGHSDSHVITEGPGGGPCPHPVRPTPDGGLHTDTFCRHFDEPGVPAHFDEPHVDRPHVDTPHSDRAHVDRG